LPEETVEGGEEEREAGGAVEEVAEGEVEDEDGGGAPEPGEALAVPEQSLGEGMDLKAA